MRGCGPGSAGRPEVDARPEARAEDLEAGRTRPEASAGRARPATANGAAGARPCWARWPGLHLCRAGGRPPLFPRRRAGRAGLCAARGAGPGGAVGGAAGWTKRRFLCAEASDVDIRGAGRWSVRRRGRRPLRGLAGGDEAGWTRGPARGCGRASWGALPRSGCSSQPRRRRARRAGPWRPSGCRLPWFKSLNLGI